jgi:hypothetical protein
MVRALIPGEGNGGDCEGDFMTRFHGAALGLLLALTFAPARSLSAEDPARLLAELGPIIEKAAGEPEPVSAIFTTLASFRDFSLTGPELKDLLARAGACDNPLLRELLPNVKKLSKTGDRLELENAEPRSIPLVVGGETKGWLHLDREATLRARGQKLDDVSGIELSEKKDSTRGTLKRIELRHDAGKPVMDVVAGWGPFSRTKTVDLSGVKPRERPTVGVVGAVEAPPPSDDPGLPLPR